MLDQAHPATGRPSLEDLLRQAGPPEWIRRMIEHYHRTGTYPPADLRRLLGDPTKGVEISSEKNIPSLWKQQ